MAKIITSDSVVFMDNTDNRKLDVYITSNLPTVQIKNSNTNPVTYTPNWASTPLVLEADAYLDSEDVTNQTTFLWYKKGVNGVETQINTTTSKQIIINSNSDLDTNQLMVYICKAVYKASNTDNGVEDTEQVTFSQVATGTNGTSGTSAPAVQAQYSANGTTGWTSTLDPMAHKYVRYSYDGGKTYTVAIKIVGEDGTSVVIKGTAYTSDSLVAGRIVTLYSDTNKTTPIDTAELSAGDSYLVNGYLCVYNKINNNFVCAGTIQGPQGVPGQNNYMYIRYSAYSDGRDMLEAPNSATMYIGVCVSTNSSAPTTASSYTWSKFVGDSAKSIRLNGSSQVFKVTHGDTETYEPTTILVSAQTVNTTVSKWEYSIDGGLGWTVFTSSSLPNWMTFNSAQNTITIIGKDLASNTLVIRASNGEYKDVYTIYKVLDGVDGATGAKGSDAPIAFLTNENISFAANINGVINNASTLRVVTSVASYVGVTKQMPTLGAIIDKPSDMNISIEDDATLQEKKLTISFNSGATLGSANSNSGTITIPVTYPVVTNLKLSWSKINTGAKGDKGDQGADAYTVLLTNESHVFAGNVSSAVASSATTQVLAYKGTTAQSVTIVSVNGVAAATTSTATGIAGLSFVCSALSGTSPTITFACTTSFVSANGSIPIVLSVGGVSITKMFTYSIAFKGSTGATGGTGPQGAHATSYWLVSSASVVQKSASETVVLTPSTLTFTGKSQTGTSAPIDYGCRWIIAYSTDGSVYTDTYTSTANESTKTFSVNSTYKAIRVRMYLAGGTTTLLDEQIIPIVADGASGATGEDAVTFRVYSSSGYALSINTPTIVLQTFAYVGDVAITAGATYQWYAYNDGVWTAIADGTNNYLSVTRDDVSFGNNYMCKMTFNGAEYVDVVTVDDKSDHNQVFVSKPSNYSMGDIWIVSDDYMPPETTVGTLLKATSANTSYADSDWVTATNYDSRVKKLEEDVATYNNYFSFDTNSGLRISAKDNGGNASPFSTTLSNTRLSFNQGTEAVAYIESNKMKIKEAEIESPLSVTGKKSGSTVLQYPVINIGNFSLVVESNGSLSIIANT